MKKAIGFLEGELCIRENNKVYIRQEKEDYLPIIKEEITNYLQTENFEARISTIVFSVLKKVFGVDTTFTKSSLKNRSLTYTDDPLYKELVKFVLNDERFKAEQAKSLKKISDFKNGEREYYKYSKKTSYILDQIFK